MLHNPLDTSVFRIQVDNPTSPALGAELEWHPPSQSRVLITSVDFTFSAANVAAARLCMLYASDGTNNWSYQAPAGTILINTIDRLTWSVGAHIRDWGAGYLRKMMPLSYPLFIQPGDTLHTLTDTINANDQIAAVFVRFLAWQDT